MTQSHLKQWNMSMKKVSVKTQLECVGKSQWRWVANKIAVELCERENDKILEVGADNKALTRF